MSWKLKEQHAAQVPESGGGEGEEADGQTPHLPRIAHLLRIAHQGLSSAWLSRFFLSSAK